MRARTFVLAASVVMTGALSAAAQTPSSPPSTSGAATAASSACQPGAMSDGLYEASARERRNKPNRAARADRKAPESSDDAGDESAGDEGDGATAITEVRLTWQCSGTGPGGAYIPAGYKVEVRGECASGSCDLGTTIAMPGKEIGQYDGVLDDDVVGFRELRFQARRKNVVLSVRTEVEGQRRPSQARYTLKQK